MSSRVARTYQAVLLLLVGVAMGSIAVDGRYLNYLKPAMHIPLVLAALVFVGVAVAELVALRRVPMAAAHEEHAGDDATCGEVGHSHFPRSGWLLVLPILAIGFVAPPALGSWAAERDAGTIAPPGSSDYAPLPAGDPVAMPLGEYGVRAVWDQGRSLAGRTVELVGFVSPRQAGGWFLTRMSLSCCAADALATKIEVRNAEAPPTDTWVRLIGRYQPSEGRDPSTDVPVIEALTVTTVRKPANPYE